ncbi:MAG: metalloprotease TldD [Succinivibrio sp.]|nr:metalloprotease TldD [Succinivibrio sp.]
MNTFEKASKILWNNTDINLEVAQKALNHLNSREIDFGDLFFERSVAEGFFLEEGIVKGGSFSISQGVGVRAVLGAKSGFAYSDVLDEKSLMEACSAAHSISHGHSCNREKIVVSTKETKPLYVDDDPIAAMDKARKAEILEILDKKARALDPRVVQVMGSLNCSYSTTMVMPTDGPARSDIKPICNITISVVMEHNGRKEEGFAATGGAVLFNTLLKDDTLDNLAKEAVRIASVNMEAIPAPAGTMPVVLGAGWPGVLVHEAVGHGLEGDFNRTGSSAYSGKIGQKVASSACTIIDDGTIPDRRGSLSFDDEGTDTACNVLIEKGILKGYMQDKQNAMLMKMKPTGNGRRQSYNCMPIPRMTNTFLQNGEYDKDEIISSVKKGIYAVNFRGGQVDITSGEFVFSASEAYLIEDGKVTSPIKGATLIGNGPKTMQQVSMVGNNLEFDCGIGMCGKAGQGAAVGIGQPTVKIDSITVGGTK